MNRELTREYDKTANAIIVYLTIMSAAFVAYLGIAAYLAVKIMSIG